MVKAFAARTGRAARRARSSSSNSSTSAAPAAGGATHTWTTRLDAVATVPRPAAVAPGPGSCPGRGATARVTGGSSRTTTGDEVDTDG
ncbi:hypothetical protein Cma02nite_32170 [Cellulomonas marina]|nr:hypothetical protein Cma02nite_32170 [Cellulomonas marina]